MVVGSIGEGGYTMIIVLISCAKKQRQGEHLAKDLYISDTFKKSLEYAQLIKHDHICILSTLYHFLPLNKKIHNYDVSMSSIKSKGEKSTWNSIVLEKIKNEYSIEDDTFIILAGKDYYGFMKHSISHLIIPMEHITQFRRVSWLNEKIKEIKRNDKSSKDIL
jgi:cytoplasmic iron level regulating protein YaaA (DUF328/UPF0246 family)